MPDPVRVLYLIGQFPAINHSYLLAEVRQLRKLGFDVQVASVAPSDRPLEKLSPIEQEEAVRTYYIKSVPAPVIALLILSECIRHPLNCLRGLSFALRLARGSLRRAVYHLAYFAEAVLVGHYARQLGITHVHASFSATVALIAARTFPVTMSFGVYGYGELHNPSETNLVERIEGALFVRSISRHGHGQLMLSCDRRDWHKLIYVPLGINATEFTPQQTRSAGSTARILCVGRLAPEKGQALLLEAVARLNISGCAASLVFVGDGPDRKFLEKQANELGIVSHVEFAGWVDQESLMRHYAEADIFILPSLAEGIPMVLMEAMAMQTPCVAPRITGIPELIEDGVDGMLYHVADLDDLTQKTRALVENSKLRERMGEQARLRVIQDYDMARNTERFARVLSEQLLKSEPQE